MAKTPWEPRYKNDKEAFIGFMKALILCGLVLGLAELSVRLLGL